MLKILRLLQLIVWLVSSESRVLRTGGHLNLLDAAYLQIPLMSWPAVAPELF